MTVLDILTKSRKPVDVSALVDKLRVNKTTVYRQIEKLIKKELVVEIEFGDGKKRYELKSLDHHHHLICKSCRKVEDITLDENVILKEALKKTSFQIESHNLEFFGYCVKCI